MEALASLFTHLIKPLYLHYPSLELSKQQQRVLQTIKEHTSSTALTLYAHLPDNIAEILLLEKKREESAEWKAFVHGLGPCWLGRGCERGVQGSALEGGGRLTRPQTERGGLLPTLSWS